MTLKAVHSSNNLDDEFKKAMFKTLFALIMKRMFVQNVVQNWKWILKERKLAANVAVW